MAEAVLHKIKKDILSCYICSVELTDAFGLPCLHGFCYECLETWYKTSEDKTQVICPACKTSVPVPKEGISGFPKHFLVQDLQKTLDMEKKVWYVEFYQYYKVWKSRLKVKIDALDVAQRNIQ